MIFTKKSPKSEAPTTLDIPKVLMDRTFFLLKKSMLKAAEVSEAALEPFGIIGRHLGVLLVLRDKGSLSQQEIGKCIHMDRTTMVQVLDELEKLGLVERQEHPTDRRSHSVLLTAKGKGTLDEADAKAMEAEKKFLSGISVKDQKELVRILRQLVTHHYATQPGEKD